MASFVSDRLFGGGLFFFASTFISIKVLKIDSADLVLPNYTMERSLGVRRTVSWM